MKILFLEGFELYCKYKDIYGVIDCDNNTITGFIFYKNKSFINCHNPYFEARKTQGVKYYYLNGDLVGTKSKKQLIVLNKLYIKNFFLFKNNKQWRKYVKMQVFK